MISKLSVSWSVLPGFQRCMILSLVVAVALAFIEQPYPDIAPLHHIPTLLLAGSAPGLLARWPLSTGSVACLFVFLLLHTLGGRYTYSNVPYDEWFEWLIGVHVSETFGFTRNHYDRFVHFSFGLLLVPGLVEALRKHLAMPSGLRSLSAIFAVLGASALYEVAEWILSLAVAAPLATDYNGQQGDNWDAQKDMLLAAIGALVATLWLHVRGENPPEG